MVSFSKYRSKSFAWWLKTPVYALKTTVYKIRLWRANLNRDPVLSNSAGIIHVGANVGQERRLYAIYNLNVLWIEPIPQVYEQLKSNILGFRNQTAIQYILTDEDDFEYQFHVSSHNGVSSSILDFGLHKDINPEITRSETIVLSSITLDSLVAKQKINLSDYDTLVLDTQGSELLVLKGSISTLEKMKYVKVEVADFESKSLSS